MSTYIVGMTGGVGSGKSRAAHRFVEHGACLVDTDHIAHELTRAGGKAMPALAAAFGTGVIDSNGALDRNMMRQLVFSDAAARAKLEAILHPMIREIALQRSVEASSAYVILAVPLMVETGGFREYCDRIVVIDCPEKLQIERVMARNGLSEKDARAILDAQATRLERLAIADDVINNDADLPNLDAQIDDLHLKYLALSTKKLKAKY